MVEWITKIDVKDEWNKFNDNMIDLGDLISSIINKINPARKVINKYYSSYLDELDSIIEELEFMKDTYPDSMVGDEDVINEIWNRFYNWTDSEIPDKNASQLPYKRLCWLRTI